MNSVRYARGPSRSRNEAVSLFAFKLGCVCALGLATICTLARAGSLAYMTQNRSLTDLELSMSNYYVALDRKNALPVQRVKDDIGATVHDLMYATGLIRGRSDTAAFPDDLTQLLCRLNPKTCQRQPGGSLRWVNKKGDVICLPAVAWQNALTLARTKLRHLLRIWRPVSSASSARARRWEKNAKARSGSPPRIPITTGQSMWSRSHRLLWSRNLEHLPPVTRRR